MDSDTLETLARQAAVILAPALPFIYEGSKAAVTKGTDVLGDMLYEKAFEKIGSKSGKKAKALLEKISPKMTESLRKALTKVSKNSEDPAAKEDLQQEILKLLRENPDLAREIELTILNIENIENIDQFCRKLQQLFPFWNSFL
jgi:transketolase